MPSVASCLLGHSPGWQDAASLLDVQWGISQQPGSLAGAQGAEAWYHVRRKGGNCSAFCCLAEAPRGESLLHLKLSGACPQEPAKGSRHKLYLELSRLHGRNHVARTAWTSKCTRRSSGASAICTSRTHGYLQCAGVALFSIRSLFLQLLQSAKLHGRIMNAAAK